MRLLAESQAPTYGADTGRVTPLARLEVSLLGIVFVDDRRPLAAATKERSARRNGASAFIKIVATQQLVEEQEKEGPGGRDAKAQRANRRDEMSLPEIRDDAAADDRA